MLEIACMMDEPQPVKDRGVSGNNGMGMLPPNSAPPAPMMSMSVTGMSVGKPDVIDEVPHES